MKFKKVSKILFNFYAFIASFVVSFSWNWYHIKHIPRARFAIYIIATWLFVYFSYLVGKSLFGFLLKRFKRHPFWRNDFLPCMDRLFLTASLFFLIFFFRNEVISLVYVSILFLVFFWQFQKYLSLHPAKKEWLVVSKSVFILAYFIFLTASVFQYISHRYYILDSNARFFNIVLFRSWTIMCFWLLGFSVSSLIYYFVKNKLKYAALLLWLLLLTACMVLWAINVEIVYYSGLYLSPTAILHAEGAGQVAFNFFTFLILFILFLLLVVLAVIFKRIIKVHRRQFARQWVFFNAVLVMAGLLSVFGLTSFRNTPEYVMAKSFYNYFFADVKEIDLNPVVLEKLKKFGLDYRPDDFYLAAKDKIWEKDIKLLSEKFAPKNPNVIIVFFESFSADLTGVYEERFKDLTPSLVDFANNENTTIFKNYFNASTPTITGILSQMCSFLPPTGHNEIEGEGKIQTHHLGCLPKFLKDNGYEYTAYITAVNKTYANKETIFKAMGMDDIFGVDELADHIDDKPLSWGYSDHQMMPFLFEMASKQKEPFLLALSTVDSHPPFNLSKDAVNYNDGKNAVLNSIHSTDDAFGKFWRDFQNSPLAENTILVAVADHAIFPGAFTKDIFPNKAGQISYYDKNMFLIYTPDSVLPKEVGVYSSGLDFAPTLLHILGIDQPNSFEGHSLFDDRDYDGVLGMHELGLYINQNNNEKRQISYDIPDEISCGKEDIGSDPNGHLTLCEYKHFYEWKRQMFEEGRFWDIR